MTDKPTDEELKAMWQLHAADIGGIFDFARAVLAKWGQPQQEAQEPCPTCIALARTVMLDQVGFDRKPDCYGIRKITDDEGVEEWEDIRTSPDVARLYQLKGAINRQVNRLNKQAQQEAQQENQE